MKKGFFGKYGGQYVPDKLRVVLDELDSMYNSLKDDVDFKKELKSYYLKYASRPTLLYYARKLTEYYGHGKIYLKREDLTHTGSHKINNALGQILLAKHMGKKCVIAETGAGSHGVATATVAALMGMKCKVFMGAHDIERQKENVFKMRLLGAEVVSVTTGAQILPDAVTAAIDYWVENSEENYYVLGSAVGPHPYPTIVRDFQSIIGEELRAQLKKETGGRVDYLVACVGGGSNAIGTFYEFRSDNNVKKIGVEAGGRGPAKGDNAQTLSTKLSKPGILHGFYSYYQQDENGNPVEVYSISAGLDYPGVGPEHAMYFDEGIASYASVTDNEAIDAFALLSSTEGIIPAIESSHAVAYLAKLMPQTNKDDVVVVTLSGRGDKDVGRMAEILSV